MNYTQIDMNSYPRRAHFDYFRSMAYPYAGVTVEVDITQFMDKIKERKLPFFLSFLYCVVNAANGVPQLRQRIRGEGIFEYGCCPASYTVALPDGTYCYCTQFCDMPFEEYLPAAKEKLEIAKVRRSLEDGEEAESLLFISCLTGISYTSITNPVPFPPDSNPRITWGRFFDRDGKVLIPLSILTNHALVDGAHMTAFYCELQQQLTQF